MGAVMAGLIEAVPGIVWLGKYKAWVFGFAGLAIAFAGWMQWRARSLPCPIDPKLARACARLRAVSWGIWWVSLVLFLVGGYFAFVAVWFF